MTTINDKFNQLGASIINLVSTRASKNLDNLSEVGLNNLVAIADAATSEAMSDYVPTSRTINGKALSSDITLTASNVGAASSSHTHSNYVSTSSLSEAQCVVETYQNGDSWYRVWSDGWCEQGGMILATSTNNTTVNLLKTYRDPTYHILTGNMYKAAVATATSVLSAPSKTVDSFTIYDSTDVNFYTYWCTYGYLY